MNKKTIIIIAVLAVALIGVCMGLWLRSGAEQAADTPAAISAEFEPAEATEATNAPEPLSEPEPAEPEEAAEAADSNLLTVGADAPGGIPEPGSYVADLTDDEGEDDGPMEVQDSYVVVLGESETHEGG